MMRNYFIYLFLISALITAYGCTKKTASTEKIQPPATVQNAVKETDLTTVILTPAAETRLGIELAAVEVRSIEKNRTYGGEVVSVSGRSITVNAPLSGTLLLPENGLVPTAGKHIATSEPIYRLLLALPRKDILTVQEEVALRQADFELADKAVRRAQQLLDDNAGSLKELEQAQSQLYKAMASLKVAKARIELLEKGEIDSADEGLSSLLVRSPIDGIIQKVHVSPGQTVTASEAMVEITSIDPVWIKVPVYVGDLTSIDSNKPAKVHNLGDFAAVETQTAEPVVASFTADPQSVTVDIFYELPNTDFSYRPGQKVSVTINLKVSEQTLVVPYSSILYDMYGGTWVYENTEPQKYVRRRTELLHVLDGLAVLSRGPAVGAKVVSAGAAELFGTEFGVGK
ncbi:MAG TPA: efflux RND transporter periplasmic adaptor subunit [Sedimentisphaerales bacterium]|nr:efflux RND transporter periplasmic adaptor subunit [Sedimentisphaerales bacterium]